MKGPHLARTRRSWGRLRLPGHPLHSPPAWARWHGSDRDSGIPKGARKPAGRAGWRFQWWIGEVPGRQGDAASLRSGFAPPLPAVTTLKEVRELGFDVQSGRRLDEQVTKLTVVSSNHSSCVRTARLNSTAIANEGRLNAREGKPATPDIRGVESLATRDRHRRGPNWPLRSSASRRSWALAYRYGS